MNSAVASTPAAGRVSATGFLLALAGAVAFSGKAIIVKLAYRYGVDAVTLIMLRMLFALPFFLLIVWWTGRAQHGSAPLTRADWLGVAGLGITGYYLASFLDFVGLAYISASLERLILYLNPTLVLLLGLVLQGRRIRPYQLLGMGISYAGVLLVFGQEATLVGPDVVLGSSLVFASAVSYALYLFYSGELVKRLGSLRLVGLATSLACLLCIAQFLLLRPVASVFSVAPQVIGLSLVNAVVCTVLPVLAVMMAIERIGPGLASQVGMVGPMSTITLGVLVLDEAFTGWIVAGTLLVLVGIFVCSRGRRAVAAD